MVWVHSGGLSNEVGPEPLYIGDNLANEGVVVVSMNFRLGALGFLATEELEEESGDGSFGGLRASGPGPGAGVGPGQHRRRPGRSRQRDDLRRVGGGVLRLRPPASPASEGLFQRAIVQSGGDVAASSLVRRRSPPATHFSRASVVPTSPAPGSCQNEELAGASSTPRWWGPALACRHRA